MDMSGGYQNGIYLNGRKDAKGIGESGKIYKKLIKSFNGLRIRLWIM